MTTINIKLTFEDKGVVLEPDKSRIEAIVAFYTGMIWAKIDHQQRRLISSMCWWDDTETAFVVVD